MKNSAKNYEMKLSVNENKTISKKVYFIISLIFIKDIYQVNKVGIYNTIIWAVGSYGIMNQKSAEHLNTIKKTGPYESCSDPEHTDPWIKLWPMNQTGPEPLLFFTGN